MPPSLPLPPPPLISPLLTTLHSSHTTDAKASPSSEDVTPAIMTPHTPFSELLICAYIRRLRLPVLVTARQKKRITFLDHLSDMPVSADGVRKGRTSRGRRVRHGSNPQRDMSVFAPHLSRWSLGFWSTGTAGFRWTGFGALLSLAVVVVVVVWPDAQSRHETLCQGLECAGHAGPGGEWKVERVMHVIWEGDEMQGVATSANLIPARCSYAKQSDLSLDLCSPRIRTRLYELARVRATRLHEARTGEEPGNRP